MQAREAWFLAGLIMLALLAMYAPRFAGMLVILLVIFLAIEISSPPHSLL